LNDSGDNAVETLVAIGGLGAEIQDLIAKLKAETDGKIRGAFARELRREEPPESSR
jgi:hypothetical protein